MIRLPSPGKLNLFLHVLGRREDGYHNLQTVFQFIDFCDEISFEIRNDGKILVAPFSEFISLEDNLIYKAALALKKKAKANVGIDITVKKQLPLGGGVGGGSSNAATTLLALNKIWELQLAQSELQELGIRLGADVPIFLHGHACWAEGRGEILTPIILPELWYVLLIPPVHAETRKFFNDSRLTWTADPLTMTHYQFGQGHNDFEPIARMDFSPIADALDWLNTFAPARMSGTGSTVFAAFDTREEASRIVALSPGQFQAVVAKGLNHSPLLAALASF